MQTKQRRKQGGFTLIELMIVVAVIGVLAAIAIPQYQKYVEKGALASALATASSLKTNYENYWAVNGSAPSAASDIGAVSFALGTVSLNASGAIEVGITSGGGSGSSVTLTRASDGSWDCAVSSASSVSINGCS